MAGKQQILTAILEEFDRWEALLASLSEAQITAPDLPSHLSVKDVIAHLMAWQQRTLARLEAARLDREPEFPAWPPGLDPNSEADLDAINAWIYDTYRDKPWSTIYSQWRAGFQRFIELAAAIPEEDLQELGRYPWMGEYPLIAIVQGSYEHHQEEHLEPLLAWLGQHGDRKD